MAGSRDMDKRPPVLLNKLYSRPPPAHSSFAIPLFLSSLLLCCLSTHAAPFTDQEDLPGDLIQRADTPETGYGSTCRYMSPLKEPDTQHLSWEVSPESEVVVFVNDGSGPPSTAVRTVHQNDSMETGDLMVCVVVSASWGTIAGTVKDNMCWFKYKGQDYQTDVFSWVATMFKLEKSGAEPPVDAVIHAWDANTEEPLYSVIAHTSWGSIPGKAKNGTCWYPINGEEHEAKAFSYIIVPKCGTALTMQSAGPPANALRTGYQNGLGEDLYAAIAKTEQWGNIPGMAAGNQCWFTHDGKEHVTSSFNWITSLCDCLPLDPTNHESGNRAERSAPDDCIRNTNVHTEDRLIQESGNLVDARQHRVTNLATNVISRWTDNSFETGRNSRTLASDSRNNRSVRMDLQGYFTRDGITYANIQIQTGRHSVAAVFIQTGVDFGARFIRRALNLSLSQTMMVWVRRNCIN